MPRRVVRTAERLTSSSVPGELAAEPLGDRRRCVPGWSVATAQDQNQDEDHDDEERSKQERLAPRGSPMDPSRASSFSGSPVAGRSSTAPFRRRRSFPIQTVDVDPDRPHSREAEDVPRLWSETIAAHRHEVRSATMAAAAQLAVEHGLLNVR